MTIVECMLCKEKKDLRISHIIPKFVLKKLKEISGTGYLRDIIDPDKRRQDGKKMPLLCDNCEKLLSQYESYFASLIFHPFIDKGISKFSYDENLLKFIISINWRTLIVTYDDFTDSYPSMKPHLDQAEKIWRDYLLNKKTQPDEYEHHLMFLDYVVSDTGLTDGFQWYSLMSADATLVGNAETVFVYTKFPKLLFISTIFPKHRDGWLGTTIESTGYLDTPQEIYDEAFGDFFVKRGEMAINQLGKADDIKIEKTLKKNPERFLKSESLKVVVAEAERRRQAKKLHLPDSIVGLIEVIEKGVTSGLDELTEGRLLLIQKIIADSISSLTELKAHEIDEKITETLVRSRRKESQTETYFETKEMLVIFIVDLSDTKEKQRQYLTKRYEDLLKTQKTDDKLSVLFSFNPNLKDFPFETLYYIPPMGSS